MTPGSFKITYSQMKDQSSVHMKHLVVDLPNTPGDANVNVLYESSILEEVHRDILM